jgi:hypothetical protein
MIAHRDSTVSREAQKESSALKAPITMNGMRGVAHSANCARLVSIAASRVLSSLKVIATWDTTASKIR